MPTATQAKPEQEAATQAATPITASITPAVTHLTFHGTAIDFTDKEVVIHTNDKVALVPAGEEATKTKGAYGISHSKDFNSVASRGVQVSKANDGLTVSFDPDIKVSVQAVPAAPKL